MASLWKTRRPCLRKKPFGNEDADPTMELSIPFRFRCPISLDLMKDPVILSTGITYDRQSIETWFDNGSTTCPVTNQKLLSNELIPNHATRKMIQDWCVENRSHGIERIPTPRIPITPIKVSEVLREIDLASQEGDHVKCQVLVGKIKAAARESERNRRCISSNGAGQAFAAAFDTFAKSTRKAHASAVLEELLSAMPAVFPLDKEACSYLNSQNSLSSLVSFLKNGGLAARLNAVLTIKELVPPEKMDATIAETEGLIEALVQFIKEPISPKATKASLLAAFYLVSSNERAASRFAEMGVVHPLLEILVDSEKSTTEKALGVLNGICTSEMGRKMLQTHALAVPVLVKKMFRVSDLATEFTISVLWKVCRSNKQGGVEEEKCLDEALKFGVFQKMLLLLQVGCGGKTKDRVTELLKLLNTRRGTLDCVDSIDLKGLNRPF